ncbi:hypothetical protein [Pseudomonas sp. S1(2024)]|uniref:hypothetical protein n=1 Tax=Pseudomonas sp. S1(2024) TaxID=3390191 RepID=UPI003979BB13
MSTHKQLPSPTLTEEQCHSFRRLPVSFNAMVQAIYDAGIAHGQAHALSQAKNAPGSQADLEALAALEALHKDIDGYEWKSALARLADMRRNMDAQPSVPSPRRQLPENEPSPF